MRQRKLDTVLQVWVVAALVVGLGILLLPELNDVFVLTSSGVVLIILGLMSLMPVVKRSLRASGG